MLATLALLVGPALASAPRTQTQTQTQTQTRMRTEYDVYAGGLQVAAFDARYDLGEDGYGIAVAYHTTGLARALFGGHQIGAAQGRWDTGGAAPLHSSGDGVWGGTPHRIAIDYDHGDPLVRELVPPNEAEREPVPPAMQVHTMDTLSALMLLVRNVGQTGRCETDVTTFDGRRLVHVVAHTGGPEPLEPTSRSSFSGPTLRCDFDGWLLAGAMRDADPAEVRRPKHGSAWFAEAVAGQPPVPVRISFETRWFGEATMYLTSATSEQPL